MQNVIIYYAFILAFLSLSVLSSNALELGQPLSDKEKIASVENLNRLQKDIASITAKVSQVKKSKILKEDLRLEGTVALKRPNLMRWEINKPEKTITVVDGEKLTVYHPAVREAQVYELSENIIARNTIEFFSSSINMSLRELEKRFFVNIYSIPENIIFELRPRSKMASRYLATVYIWYNEKNGLPSEFEVTGTKGDTTHTRLTDIVVNPELESDVFHLKLTDEVWITNKTGPDISN